MISYTVWLPTNHPVRIGTRPQLMPSKVFSPSTQKRMIIGWQLAIVVRQTCTHELKSWTSTRQLWPTKPKTSTTTTYSVRQKTVNRVHTGDLKICSSILLSENNYAKIAMMAKQFSVSANFSLPLYSTFLRVQNKYVCPAVQALGDSTMSANIRKHKAKESGVVLLGEWNFFPPQTTSIHFSFLFCCTFPGNNVHGDNI